MSGVSQKSRYLWLNGEIVPWEKPMVHITTVGGMSTLATVYEGLRGYWNSESRELFVFRLEDHMKRFDQSMRLVRMEPPFTPEQLALAVVDLVKANELRENTYIQARAFFDPMGPWGTMVEDPTSGQVLINAFPRPSRLAGGEPVDCCVSSWTRISDNVMPPRIKCLSNYQNSRLAEWEAHLNGYESAVMLQSEGKVSEGPGYCIFIARDGLAITPSITSAILESITRETLLELFREELGVAAVEREVDRTELYVADEAFFCGTGWGEVTPIASIDRYPLGAGSPGPLTEAIRRLYYDVVRGKNSRYEHWLTKID
jgi:branched-chain amino acid aminotransferase